MEWNNGTIFRIYVSSFDKTIINTKVDISQMQLNNKCYIGVENYMLRPKVDTAEQQDFWSFNTYIQLQSLNLPPFIDYSSYDDPANNNGGNTRIFARLPLIAVPTLGDALATTQATFGYDRVLNKDSILYEMINNPNALSGNFNVRILDDEGYIVPDDYILSFFFTLVIYKPSNKYN
jgi:hypothetical protein